MNPTGNLRQFIPFLVLSTLLSFLGFGCKKNGPESDTPDFFPASEKVFEYQRQGLAKVATELGRTPEEILAKQTTKGRDAAFEALELLCSWKYINRRPLNEIERFTLCIRGLPMEVNNGGFHQYFSNSAGDDWDIIAWGLKESGDLEGLARFKEVLAVFPNSRPSRNRVVRNRQLDNLGEAQWTAFNRFDSQFYDKPFPDWDKVMALISNRASEFRLEWPDAPANPGKPKG